MKNSKMRDNAHKLAKEKVRIENQIQFQIGGCIVNYIPYKFKISAM